MTATAALIGILRALRALDPGDRERRAILTRDLAEAIVKYREHFLLPDGAPDWTGQTWAYRNAVSDLYAEAGYSRAERATMQGAVRFHVGNIVRRYLSPDDLDAAGLRPESPPERQTKRRARNAALLATIAEAPRPRTIPTATRADRAAVDAVDLPMVVANQAMESIADLITDDHVYRTLTEGLAEAIRAAGVLARSGAWAPESFDAEHVEFPHEPGTLYDCVACESLPILEPSA